MNNPFGAPQQQQQQQQPAFGGFGASPSPAPPQQSSMFGSNAFAPQSPAPQQQTGPTPPSSSFTFGAAPASNPFASASQSQSFGGFGASQNTPSFSPLKTDSFNFGGPPAPTTNGAFSFGANSPAKPAEPSKSATNGVSAFGSGTSSTMFGQPPQPAALTDAEIKEIEDAGPRLAADNKLADLEKIVRESDPKYQVGPYPFFSLSILTNHTNSIQNASLAGLNLRELPIPAQQKLLAFVKNPAGTTNTVSTSTPNITFPGQPNPFAKFSTFGKLPTCHEYRGSIFTLEAPPQEPRIIPSSPPVSPLDTPETLDLSRIVDGNGLYTCAKAHDDSFWQRRTAEFKKQDKVRKLKLQQQKQEQEQQQPQNTMATPRRTQRPLFGKKAGAPRLSTCFTSAAVEAAFTSPFTSPAPIPDASPPFSTTFSDNTFPQFQSLNNPISYLYPQPHVPSPSSCTVPQGHSWDHLDRPSWGITFWQLPSGKRLPAPQATHFYPHSIPQLDPGRPPTQWIWTSETSCITTTHTDSLSKIQTPQKPVSFSAPTPAAAPSNPFASLSRSTADSTPKPPVTFGSRPAESTPPTPFAGFGASTAATPKPADQASYPNLNGASSSQTQSPAAASAPKFDFGKSETPKFDLSKPETPKLDFSKPETPKPASNGLGSSMFASTPNKGFGSTPNPAPSSTSVFNAAPAQSSSSTPFKFSSANDPTPKPDSAATPAPQFSFGASAAPASPTPQQDAAPSFSAPNLSASFSAAPKQDAAPASTPKPQLFSAAPSASPATQQAATPKINFGASFSTQPASSPAPAFGGFAASTPKPPSSAAPTFTSASQATPQANAPAKPTTTAPRPSTPNGPDNIAQKNRELNEAFRRHLASLDPTQDWSHIARHYLGELGKITSSARVDAIPDPTPKPATMSNGFSTPAGTVQAQAPAPPGSSAINKRKAEEEASREDINKRSKAGVSDFSQSLSAASPNKPYSKTASMFDDILNTPTKDSSPVEPPATAPAKASSFGSFTPAAPKVAAPPAETPKANPFATLTKVNNTPAAPPASETPKPAASSFQFNPSTAAEPAKADATAAASSPFQFKPAASTSSAPAAPAFSIPKFGAGGASTPNFLSAFGARAADEEKKEREKRKLEDMDSDDDEEEWEKKDAEEQAAKRKQMLEDAANAAKLSFKPTSTAADKPAGSVFSFGGENKTTPAPAASSSNIFGHLSGKRTNQDDEEDDEEDADADESATPTAAPAKSLFDRVEKPSNGDKPATASTPFKFGGASTSANIFGNTTSPAGDNTWKGESNTPIKFGFSKAKDTDGATTPEGSPAKNAFGGIANAGNATAPPRFGGFTASSIHDSPAPKLDFGQSTAAPPSSSIFGGASKPLEKNKPASAASSGLNASIFSPAGKSSSAGFTFGTPNTGAAPAAPLSTNSSVFGNSAATSRDTTPVTATNTDAEGSGADANEPSDEVKDTPQNDLASLTPEEASANEVLFESKAKASQFVPGTKAWESKGYGIFRLLKNKETGKSWALMRMTPGGRVMLNFSLLSKSVEGAYQASGKICRCLVAGEGGKIETWGLQFGTLDKVKDLVGKMKDGQPE